jgi:hypothetical protein
MSVGRSSGSMSEALWGVGADLERIGVGVGEMATQQAEILERIDRLVALNEQMWDHHLQFCGRLIETVTQTEMELLQAQTELESQLDALRTKAPAEKPGN